jgi:peptide/nickel transport system substrate-binding protein
MPHLLQTRANRNVQRALCNKDNKEMSLLVRSYMGGNMKLDRWLLIAFLMFFLGFGVAQSTARIGWAGSPDSLVPGKGILTEAYTIYELVYDTMFDLQFDGSFKPELAESFETSEDGKTWAFHIHQGLKWHDGEPFSASDIVFTYNLYKNDEDFAYLNSYTTYFESVTASDENTVVIKLTEAIPNMEAQLIAMYVLPEHIFKDAPVEFENTEMIGTGSFKILEYKQGEFVRLGRNADYWAGSPKVDQLIFQTFGSQDVLVQAIKTGQVDMITEMPFTSVVALRNDPNVELAIGAPLSPYTADIIINQMESDRCPAEGGVCSGHPALQDRNVRLALSHATDKQQLADVVLLGLGTPGPTLIPDSVGQWFNNAITDYAFDVEKANKILDDAGYKDSDSNGIRDMPDGSRPLTFRLNWPSDSINAPRLAELLSDMWKQIGVSLQLQALDPDALTAICCPAFDYDLMIWGWYADPDPSYLLGVMTTQEIVTGLNETGYSNSDYDTLFKQQATTLDNEKRKEIVWQMQQMVFDDLVYIIPYYEQEVQAFRKDRFTGWIIDQGKIALEDPSSLNVIEPVQ